MYHADTTMRLLPEARSWSKTSRREDFADSVGVLTRCGRPLIGSLSANLQRFGFERVAKIETLQEIIDEIGTGTG